MASRRCGYLAALLVACSAPEPCYYTAFASVTAYDVRPNAVTPRGVWADLRYAALDLSEIDRRIDAVERCLAEKYPAGEFPADLVHEARCMGNHFDLPLRRECLTVAIPPDWYMGCSGQQVFPCAIDPKLCEDKGLTPSDACPCACRSAIQDYDTIIVTPDLQMLQADVIRYATRCNWIWLPGLQECYEP